MVGFYAWQMAKCIIYSLHTESDLIIFLDDLSLSLESAFEISLQGSFELLFAVYKAFPDLYWVANVVSLKPYHY